MSGGDELDQYLDRYFNRKQSTRDPRVKRIVERVSEVDDDAFFESVGPKEKAKIRSGISSETFLRETCLPKTIGTPSQNNKLVVSQNINSVYQYPRKQIYQREKIPDSSTMVPKAIVKCPLAERTQISHHRTNILSNSNDRSSSSFYQTSDSKKSQTSTNLEKPSNTKKVDLTKKNVMSNNLNANILSLLEPLSGRRWQSTSILSQPSSLSAHLLATSDDLIPLPPHVIHHYSMQNDLHYGSPVFPVSDSTCNSGRSVSTGRRPGTVMRLNQKEPSQHVPPHQADFHVTQRQSGLNTCTSQILSQQPTQNPSSHTFESHSSLCNVGGMPLSTTRFPNHDVSFYSNNQENRKIIEEDVRELGAIEITSPSLHANAICEKQLKLMEAIETQQKQIEHLTSHIIKQQQTENSLLRMPFTSSLSRTPHAKVFVSDFMQNKQQNQQHILLPSPFNITPSILSTIKPTPPAVSVSLIPSSIFACPPPLPSKPPSQEQSKICPQQKLLFPPSQNHPLLQPSSSFATTTAPPPSSFSPPSIISSLPPGCLSIQMQPPATQRAESISPSAVSSANQSTSPVLINKENDPDSIPDAFLVPEPSFFEQAPIEEDILGGSHSGEQVNHIVNPQQIDDHIMRQIEFRRKHLQEIHNQVIAAVNRETEPFFVTNNALDFPSAVASPMRSAVSLFPAPTSACDANDVALAVTPLSSSSTQIAQSADHHPFSTLPAGRLITQRRMNIITPSPEDIPTPSHGNLRDKAVLFFPQNAHENVENHDISPFSDAKTPNVIRGGDAIPNAFKLSEQLSISPANSMETADCRIRAIMSLLQTPSCHSGQ
eukprot:GDKK01066236.1.p1 GENE.GDKK01066236.1~~GDKK01066236.1.p1  ORF type:complete len:827 (-),score=168.68 GDKK01066236.1:102-2582(-)